jgi:hypothetical protein
VIHLFYRLVAEFKDEIKTKTSYVFANKRLKQQFIDKYGITPAFCSGIGIMLKCISIYFFIIAYEL